jgi:cell division protein FtsL
MKIQSGHFARKGERGMASLIFIILLAIMVILVTAESRALFTLHLEAKSLEQKQIKRLNASEASSAGVIKPDSK